MNKRWRDRSQRWRSPGDVFDPRRFAVDGIDRDAEPKRFVEQHHYAGSYPAAVFRVGLFGPGCQLAGVAVFSNPPQPRALPRWTGAPIGAAAELGRFVLLDDVGYNAETWFLARAFRLLREHTAVRRVLSYADPLERPEIAKPAHWGTVYQASNAIYAGLSESRWQHVAPTGEVASRRMLNKIRQGHQGWRYGVKWLRERGAPAPAATEPLGAWVDRVIAGWRRVYHPGNLAYVFGLDDRAREALRQLHRGGRAYEKARLTMLRRVRMRRNATG